MNNTASSNLSHYKQNRSASYQAADERGRHQGRQPEVSQLLTTAVHDGAGEPWF